MMNFMNAVNQIVVVIDLVHTNITYLLTSRQGGVAMNQSFCSAG